MSSFSFSSITFSFSNTYFVPMDSYEFSKFHGYENEDVERWLNKLGLLLTALGIAHDSRIASATLGFYLAGSAEIWYSTLPEATRQNFSLAKEALIERFASQDLKWRLRQKLISMKQGENESLENYIDTICHTCQRVGGISDKQQMTYFVKGLKYNIKREVLMRVPKTYDEAESIARHVVAVEKILNPSADNLTEFFEPYNRDFVCRTFNLDEIEAHVEPNFVPKLPKLVEDFKLRNTDPMKLNKIEVDVRKPTVVKLHDKRKEDLTNETETEMNCANSNLPFPRADVLHCSTQNNVDTAKQISIRNTKLKTKENCNDNSCEAIEISEQIYSVSRVNTTPDVKRQSL